MKYSEYIYIYTYICIGVHGFNHQELLFFGDLVNSQYNIIQFSQGLNITPYHTYGDTTIDKLWLIDDREEYYPYATESITILRLGKLIY